MGACGWSGVGIETIRRVGKRDIESGSAGGCLIVRDQGESDVGRRNPFSAQRRWPLLVKLYETLDFDEPNYNGVCQCLAILEDDKRCADVLLSLVKSSDERDNLQAYQIGFNLFEMDLRNFLNGVADLVVSFFHDWTNSSQRRPRTERSGEASAGELAGVNFARRDAGKVVLGILKNEIAQADAAWWKN